VSATVRDIGKGGDIFLLAIRLDFRDADASLKTEESDRKVPLHPALIEEGLMEYVAGLPKDGSLFPDIPPDRFGRRSGTATKWIGKCIRQTVGITDRRFDPNHSWRHARAQRQRLRRLVPPHQSLELTALDRRQLQPHRLAVGHPELPRKRCSLP
jgi:hypothetical protein